MIEGLKPYAEYKDSRLNWLGKLPATWELRRAKFLFREVDERSKTGKEELLSVSHKTGVTPRSQKNITMFMAESNVGHKICRPQDLVINTLWAWMAAMGVSNQTGVVSPAYGVYRPIDTEVLLPRFSDQLLRTPLYADEYKRRSTGVNSSRLRLYPESFLGIPVVLPPLEEQATIVRFLDHANRKIDGFIRAKRKLIGLLNEQKQVIIHRAVTRGLDPDVPLKPSNIPWLGDIPKHWEVKRIRQIATMNPSKSESSEDIRRNSLVVFLPMEKVGTTGAIDASVRLPASTISSGLTYFRRGDVLVAKITPCFENGKGAFLDDIPTDFGFGSTEFHVIRPSRNLLGGFLRLVTSSRMFIANGENNLTGSAGQQRVPTDFVRNYPIVLPPMSDQQLILEEVAKETVTISTAISRTEREIALMQEYRTRLTADIVTGKLDVRDAAAILPDTKEIRPTDEEVSMDDGDEEVNESN